MPPLFEVTPFAIVFGGTLLAIVLRRGRDEVLRALTVLAWLLRPRLQAAHLRAKLAPLVARIVRDGILRADHMAAGDIDIDQITGWLLITRSAEQMRTLEDEVRAKRRAERQIGADVMCDMAQIAPVVGLAGTLFSLASLANPAGAADGLMQAVGLAVLTTLYGVVLAHLVADPIASLIERRAAEEDRQRRELFEWFRTAIAPAVKHRHDGPLMERVA